jgi:NAD-dependent deacetylase
MKDLIEKAAQFIKTSNKVVAFTGAGVSQESGIPTYRGQDGLWKKYDPLRYADIKYFLQNPSYYWSFFRDIRYPALSNSKPNPAHLAIADLEKNGKLEAVITQNIDGLHQEAGNLDVIELHGNTRVIGCLDCEKDISIDAAYERLQKELPPSCAKCGGMLKPRVVFFGEPLPEDAMRRAAQAVLGCDLLLVVGSTLEVYPAASLPVTAKRAGAKIIIVNVGATAMDELADVRIDAKAGEALPEIVEAATR